MQKTSPYSFSEYKEEYQVKESVYYVLYVRNTNILVITSNISLSVVKELFRGMNIKISRRAGIFYAQHKVDLWVNEIMVVQREHDYNGNFRGETILNPITVETISKMCRYK